MSQNHYDDRQLIAYLSPSDRWLAITLLAVKIHLYSRNSVRPLPPPASIVGAVNCEVPLSVLRCWLTWSELSLADSYELLLELLDQV